MAGSTAHQPRLRSLILTLVRHGESTDNIRTIWAGHRDATLTNFGHAQAQRLGQFFKDQSFNRIFCSDLRRAKLTANQIRLQNLKNPVESMRDSMTEEEERERGERADDHDRSELTKNRLIVVPLIKEQGFGEAEGERWDSGRCTAKDYYTNRALKFKDGESREDVNLRAQSFVDQILIPEWISIIDQQPELGDELHFVIVSHGIFLSELIGVLGHLVHPSTHPATDPDHFSNTGWTRIKIVRNFVDGKPEEYVKLETIASNQVSHLIGLQRQAGGIGDAPWDPKQLKLDSFVKTVL